MHEMSLLEDLLAMLEQNAQAEGYRRIKKISLEIGRLSCVEPDALRFAFDVVMNNTLAEQAELEIVRIDGEGRCSHCGQTVPMETRHDPCSVCGRPGVTICQGDAMRVLDLIVN